MPSGEGVTTMPLWLPYVLAFLQFLIVLLLGILGFFIRGVVQKINTNEARLNKIDTDLALVKRDVQDTSALRQDLAATRQDLALFRVQCAMQAKMGDCPVPQPSAGGG